MNIYPAIDIKNGKAVRLTQGDFAQMTEYANNPLDMAQKWAAAGASYLHIVDLDAALAGTPVNIQLIQAMMQQHSIKIQVGGGIRNLQTVEQYLNAGIHRVIIGTKAVEDPKFLQEAAKKFPQQVALGLDTKGDFISTHGWTQTSTMTVQDFFDQVDVSDLACLIHTEIERDGMLSGLPIVRIKNFLDKSKLPVIVSGGVANIDDIRNLKLLKHKNLDGVIIGKALYENQIDLTQAIQEAASL